MHLKIISHTVWAIVLVLFCGAAIAQCITCPPPAPICPTCTNSVTSSSPNVNSGLQFGLFTNPALGNAGALGSTISNFVSGGGTANAGLDVKRYSLSGSTGAAAAPGGTQWNVWGAYSHNNVAYEFSPLSSSGHVNVYIAGIDYTFSNNVVFGVATAFDHTSVDLNFSGGVISGSGYTISPYVGMLINKNLSVDATLGVGRTSVDTIVTGVTGSSHTNRTIGALGLTYREAIGAWTLTGRGAILGVHDQLGAYTLSNGTFIPDGTVNVSQVRLTGQAAYTIKSFTPYVSLTYINDLNRPDQQPVNGVSAANDRDAWTPAIGIRFKADNAIYGSAQYSSERGRSDVKNNMFLLNLGIRF